MVAGDTSVGWSTDDGRSTDGTLFVGRKSQIICPTARDVRLLRLLLDAARVILSGGDERE